MPPSRAWLGLDVRCCFPTAPDSMSASNALQYSCPLPAEPTAGPVCGSHGRAACLPEASMSNRFPGVYFEGAQGGPGPAFRVSAPSAHLGVPTGLCSSCYIRIPRVAATLLLPGWGTENSRPPIPTKPSGPVLSAHLGSGLSPALTREGGGVGQRLCKLFYTNLVSHPIF